MTEENPIFKTLNEYKPKSGSFLRTKVENFNEIENEKLINSSESSGSSTENNTLDFDKKREYDNVNYHEK